MTYTQMESSRNKGFEDQCIKNQYKRKDAWKQAMKR